MSFIGKGPLFSFFPPQSYRVLQYLCSFVLFFSPELTLFDLSLRSDTEPLLKTKRKNSNKVRLGRV